MQLRPGRDASRQPAGPPFGMGAYFFLSRRVNPVTLAELRDIVETRSETALGVSDLDIRRMLRLTAAE